jgi:hypothetical protein
MREQTKENQKSVSWVSCEPWSCVAEAVSVDVGVCGKDKKGSWNAKKWRKAPEVLAISVGWGSSRRH